jgi:hypothetical protein
VLAFLAVAAVAKCSSDGQNPSNNLPRLPAAIAVEITPTSRLIEKSAPESG